MNSNRRLLAVLAHPDDESFGMGGTLALYAQQGVDVHLICATRGEVGETPPDFVRNDSAIAELRMDELRCAGLILGLKMVHFLNYRDSGMPGSEDNQHPRALTAAPMEQVASEIARYIREIQPQVVLTFDPFGGYGHPDHIAIQRATERAFFLAGEKTAIDSLAPYQAQKLYFHTFPHRSLNVLVRILSLFGKNPRKWGRNHDIDLLEITEHSYPVHAQINFRSVAKLKDQASACHQSQLMPGSSGLLWSVLRIFSGPESFMRANPPGTPKTRERDLFVDVE
ncbi:MAG: GlcNAc-PI de-N-acetylase [Anaerolineales bacterium]|nr:MAG: GlcNAc-PI de-N-acetylase [Anaerolineales bacterium]